MKTKWVLLLAIIGGAMMAFGACSTGQTAATEATGSLKGSSYEAKVDERGQVTVEVTPKNLGPESERTVFTLAANTHSVDLNLDVAKVAQLKDDQGQTYGALSWNGGRGGHHLEGEILFPKLDPRAKEVTLTIEGVGGVTKTFTWKLK